MNFPQFLGSLTRQKNCKLIAELYEKLGGEKKLGIAIRTFRAVAKGEMSPSPSLFSAIFSQTPSHMKKDAVVAFFESNGKKGETKEVVSYLEEQLNVTIKSDIESLWTDNEPQLFSEKQLSFLASSNEALRIYNRMLLHNGLKDSEANTPEKKQIVKTLVELGLGVRGGTGITMPAKNLFRYPHQDNSPRELVAPATDVIMRHINAYIAREGVPGEQELGISLHTCLKKDAITILEEMKNFKRWVQSLGLKEDHPDEVSFVWVDFGRIIKKDRDY